MAAFSLNDLMRRYYSGVTGVDPDNGSAVPALSQPVNTAPATAASAPASRVLAASTSASLLATNLNRRGATIVNRSGQEVFIRYGNTASDTAFHWVLANGEKYEVPFGITASINGFSVLAGTAPGLLVGEYTA